MRFRIHYRRAIIKPHNINYKTSRPCPCKFPLLAECWTNSVDSLYQSWLGEVYSTVYFHLTAWLCDEWFTRAPHVLFSDQPGWTTCTPQQQHHTDSHNISQRVCLSFNSSTPFSSTYRCTRAKFLGILCLCLCNLRSCHLRLNFVDVWVRSSRVV
jgi:hypothetical protein